MTRYGRFPSTLLPALALAGPILLGGCELTTSVGRPETARISITGPSGAPVELLTSLKFLVSGTAVEFIESDTATVTVPLDRSYDLLVPARFFVRITNQEAVVRTFSLKVYIGDRQWYDETRELEEGESMQFVYRFTEPVL